MFTLTRLQLPPFSFRQLQQGPFIFHVFLWDIWRRLRIQQIKHQRPTPTHGCSRNIRSNYCGHIPNGLKTIISLLEYCPDRYIIVGLTATVSGLTAGITHIFNHGIIKAALLWPLVCCPSYKTSDLRDLSGLGKRMPFTSADLLSADSELSVLLLPLDS